MYTTEKIGSKPTTLVKAWKECVIDGWHSARCPVANVHRSQFSHSILVALCGEDICGQNVVWLLLLHAFAST